MDPWLMVFDMVNHPELLTKLANQWLACTRGRHGKSSEVGKHLGYTISSPKHASMLQLSGRLSHLALSVRHTTGYTISNILV